uniref:Uncharacterized protein n=1 Tax=Vitis vinifera TaxID=29760 RepID=F6HYD9_VITVI
MKLPLSVVAPCPPANPIEERFIDRPQRTFMAMNSFCLAGEDETSTSFSKFMAKTQTLMIQVFFEATTPDTREAGNH